MHGVIRVPAHGLTQTVEPSLGVAFAARFGRGQDEVRAESALIATLPAAVPTVGP